MKKQFLHMKIETSLKEQAEEMAAKLEHSLSGYVRLAIKEKVNRDKQRLEQ